VLRRTLLFAVERFATPSRFGVELFCLLFDELEDSSESGDFRFPLGYEIAGYNAGCVMLLLFPFTEVFPDGLCSLPSDCIGIPSFLTLGPKIADAAALFAALARSASKLAFMALIS
jgi:hypothetical protein